MALDEGSKSEVIIAWPSPTNITERTPRILVCFRNDDPSATSSVKHESQVLEIFDRYGVRQTIGVIPLQHIGGATYLSLSENRGVVAMLRKWIEEGKAEIALHGFTHQGNPYVSVPSRREMSEFRGLTEAEQIRRLRAGVTILESTFGFRPKYSAMLSPLIMPPSPAS